MVVNGKSGISWASVVPWFIAIVSLTFFISDRLNAPAKVEASITRQVTEIQTDVKWLKENVGQLRQDLTSHIEREK